MHHGRRARVARGVVVAAFAIFVASLAHTVGGGAPPGVLALTLAAAFAIPFTVALAGGRWRGARTAVSAIGSQLALHTLYSLSAAESALGVPIHAPGTAIAAHDAHASMAAQHPLIGTADAVAPAGVASASSHDGTLMLVSHAIAALLAVAVIAVADRAIDAISRVAAAAAGEVAEIWVGLAALLGGTHLGPNRRLPVRFSAREPSEPHALAHLLSTLRHRGPPAFATAR